MTRRAAPVLPAVRHTTPGSLILSLNIAAFVLFSLTVPGFASAGNLEAVLLSAVPLLLLSTGQTFVLISGGIDLSAPSIVGLSSVAGGLAMTSGSGTGPAVFAAAPAAGVAAMLVMGALTGAANGASIGWLRMPAFMVTLTLGMFAGGLAVWLARLGAGAETIFDLPAAFVRLGGTGPVAVALAAGLTLSAHATLDRTQFGRFVRAIGYNPRAALASGVPVERVLCGAYVTSGLFAALAAVLITGHLETASPTHGRQLLLDVIGATVIGGTSLSGGRGSVAGTALGVLFLASLGNGLTLLNLSDFVITIIKGLLILAAALLDSWRAGRGAI